MSVRSRGLIYAAVVVLVSGCAVLSTGDGTGVGESTSSGKLSRSTGSSIGGVGILGSGDIAAGDVPSGGDTPAPTASRAHNESVQDLIVSDKVALTSESAPIKVRMERGNGFSRVIVDTSKIAGASATPRFEVQDLTSPPRMVVDILGTTASVSKDSTKTLHVAEDRYLSAVRIGNHSNKTRIVFDLTSYGAKSESVERMIDKEKGSLSISFVDKNESEERVVKASTEKGAAAAEEISAPEPTQVSTAPDTTIGSPASGSSVTMSSMNFSKASSRSGQIIIGLSDSAPYNLEQTAPTEYALTIAGTTPAATADAPQVSPPDFPGIRSARAVQAGDNTIVRMFVDAGVTLRAKQAGTNIVIDANPPTSAAANPAARAQAKIPDAAKDEEAASGAGADASAGEDAARSNPTGIESSDGSKIYTGRLISLDLQDTDIDNALRIIAEVSNLNIIASDDVTGKVTLRLIDVPWDQALDVILKTNGLDSVQEGNVIRIAPVDKLRQEREALMELKRQAIQLEDLRVEYLRVSYARVQDLKEQVEAILSERGSVSVDERTNQLIVKDIKHGQDAARDLIRKLDLRTPQVLLETQIVEAQRSILRELGFQWNYTYVASPETGNATGAVFPNSITLGGAQPDLGGNSQIVNYPSLNSGPTAGSAIGIILDSADGTRQLSAILSAFENEGRAKVISRPQVATVNNKAAQIKSVETIRVRLPDQGLSVATGQGAVAQGGGNTATEKIEVGITLDVTPQASPDYYVLLDVRAKSSTFGTRQIDAIPSIIDREAISTILMKSGQTFALGGVYRINDQDTLTGVPFFKDVPVIGALFRRSGIQKADEELIFFITPHIVEGSFDPSAL